ncbi:MAG: EAL domain-containing protein [Methyloprofundus sp.]|nr:EAL domain-containing protein [Methyloprofundus sp.]
MQAKQNKSINLTKLPALINHMIVMSVIFASIFLIFILQQWKFISFNAELRSQYHLPSIFIAYQLEKELSDIGQRVPDDIASLYMAQMMSEYNVDMQAQTQFSYQRKILGDLLAKLDELQAQQDLASFIAAYRRLERSLVILQDTLIQNETALRIESAAINIDLQQAKITVEQFRRLHERSASYVEMVGQEASNRMVWSVSILGVTLLFMWSIVIVRSSGVVRGAIITQQQSEQKITESQQLLEAILNHATACIYLKDLEGKYLFINRQFELLFDISNEELLGQTDYVVHPNDIAKKLREHDRQVLVQKNNIDFEEVVEQRDGLHTYMSTKFPLFDQEGKVYGICGMSTDISKRKEIELNLKKLSLAVEHSPNLVVITNTEGIIEYVNHKITEMTGYFPAEVIGKKPDIFNASKTPESVYKELWETIKAGNEWRGVLQNKKKNGEYYWAQESIAPVKNDALEITHFVAIQEDVTAARKLSDKLSYQAEHDALTGLMNRQAFEQRLDRVLETAYANNSEHALCFLDLDQFKIVNDSCSHAAGDELLRQLSKHLEESIRHRDTLARLGGDEFAILMEHCSLDQARRTANKVLATVAQFQFVWDNQSFRIGVSIGLVPISEQSGSVGEVLKQADVACYAAKDAGRNRVHVFLQHDDNYMQQHHGEMSWVNKINYALDHDRFILYAQIISPLHADLEPHYEILIRMLGENDEIISPGAFLPTVERYHLAQKIDRWVIHNTFIWIKENPDLYQQNTIFSVNLSGQNLGDELLLEFIFNEFAVTGIHYKNICFEITETATIFNLSAASDFISRLKYVGCRFSIDDFGSGLSSFDYLKKLPVDYLKIDGIFVKDIIDDPVDLALVKSINEIGHVMGKQTIAEFVENQAILDELNNIGVDFVQGYHVGRPHPLSELRVV